MTSKYCYSYLIKNKKMDIIASGCIHDAKSIKEIVSNALDNNDGNISRIVIRCEDES